MKKIKWKYLIISLAIPLTIGGLSALLTIGNTKTLYSLLIKPPLSPPSWVFSVVWTSLFVLMGISSYLVYTARECSTKKKSALKYYLIQLVLVFFWPIIFFNYELFLLAFVWLILIIFFSVLMIKNFLKINKVAGLLQIPYLLWLLFAAYLNLAIFILNL